MILIGKFVMAKKAREQMKKAQKAREQVYVLASVKVIVLRLYGLEILQLVDLQVPFLEHYTLQYQGMNCGKLF